MTNVVRSQYIVPFHSLCPTNAALKSSAEPKVLRPELRYYARSKETTNEVGLSIGLRDDLYIVLAGIDDSGINASLKVFVNPLQIWLWFGGIIMAIGTIIVLLPLGNNRANLKTGGTI